MFDTWDGVWTYDLLRDLCGGVTRRQGAFKARKYLRERGRFVYAGPVAVERVGVTNWKIGGTTFGGTDDAVAYLNSLYAVPLYDDGREWKVRRPDPDENPANCPDCKGTGEADCPDCDGTGDCVCHCGHSHDCHECDGSGKVRCDGCEVGATAKEAAR